VIFKKNWELNWILQYLQSIDMQTYAYLLENVLGLGEFQTSAITITRTIANVMLA
jgi:hypothetical protein